MGRRPMADSLFNLSGRVAVVTGSTRGIGLAIVHRMAEHGAQVVVSSRKEDACREAAESINAEFPGAAIAQPCNIGSKEQLEQLVGAARRAFGHIDVLVCNAAVNPFAGSMIDISDTAFDKVINSNIRSNHWLCQMVLPEMRRRRDGSVIVISSTGGLVGTDVLGTYTLSKAADMQLARNIAVEFGADNVRANSIAPGMIRTDFARYLWDDSATLARATARMPLRRVGEPDEIAGVAVMLASPAGRYITGQTIVVDGGSTIGPTI